MLHRGKLVASFVMGTKRAYDFVHDNPALEMHPSHYVNDPFVIAKNHGMVTVNSALAVDLTGQVCAGVTTTRSDVHYVVTEFGVAALHGKTIRERAHALVAIAHPAFRDALLEGARRDDGSETSV